MVLSIETASSLMRTTLFSLEVFERRDPVEHPVLRPPVHSELVYSVPVAKPVWATPATCTPARRLTAYSMAFSTCRLDSLTLPR